MKTARRERRRCQDVNKRNKSSSAQKNSTAADGPMKLSIMIRVIQQEVDQPAVGLLSGPPGFFRPNRFKCICNGNTVGLGDVVPQHGP